MNLSHLRTLIAIVEQESLSAAARTLRISQPAVTKQLQRMESELGLSLMERGPLRPVELTPAGERVLAFARETLARFDGLQEDLAILKDIGPGTLTLAASTIPGEYVLPALLAEFKAIYPQIEVKMIVSDTTEVTDRLVADEADVGVVGSPVGRPGLSLERLTSDEIVLIVPPDHAFAGRDEVGVAELRDEPLILREEGSGTQHSVRTALAAAGTELPAESVRMSLGSTQAVIQAVEQGLGLGFVSARAAAQAEADGHLACVRLESVDLSRDLYLATLSRRAGDPAVAHFLDFARSQFAA